MFFKHGGWGFFYKFALSFLKCLQDDLLDLEDISEILSMVKLKHAKNQFDGGTSSDAYSTSQKSRYDRSTERTSPHRSQQNKVKKIINKYILGKEEKINSESFKNEDVWERLI